MPVSVTEPCTEHEQATEEHRVHRRHRTRSARPGTDSFQHDRQRGQCTRNAEHIHELHQT